MDGLEIALKRLIDLKWIAVTVNEDDTFRRLKRPTREELWKIVMVYSREYEITGKTVELKTVLEENFWTWEEWEGMFDV